MRWIEKNGTQYAESLAGKAWVLMVDHNYEWHAEAKSDDKGYAANARGECATLKEAKVYAVAFLEAVGKANVINGKTLYDWSDDLPWVGWKTTSKEGVVTAWEYAPFLSTSWAMDIGDWMYSHEPAPKVVWHKSLERRPEYTKEK